MPSFARYINAPRGGEYHSLAIGWQLMWPDCFRAIVGIVACSHRQWFTGTQGAAPCDTAGGLAQTQTVYAPLGQPLGLDLFYRRRGAGYDRAHARHTAGQHRSFSVLGFIHLMRLPCALAAAF